MSKPDGGPASGSVTAVRSENDYAGLQYGVLYPSDSVPQKQIITTTGGMSLRQWYAGMAMQGMAARDIAGTPKERSEAAFAIADAMIAEGEK